MSVKEDAIKQYQEDEIKKAKRGFEVQVNSLLESIHALSRQLAEAKQRLRELEFVEPTFADIE